MKDIHCEYCNDVMHMDFPDDCPDPVTTCQKCFKEGKNPEMRRQFIEVFGYDIWEEK